ncbi:MAG: L-threonylcarbamoyladenylate synthase [Actinomycetota bacterium]
MSFLSLCNTETLKSAALSLKEGHLVAFPTETVYGLGADALNPVAVARIYDTKGRPSDHPLIVHIASLDGMGQWSKDIPDYAITLARDFWPGPMTLILKRSEIAEDFITGGQETIGLRVPAHPIALSLINEFYAIGGKGIAAPSANRFGAVSPTTAEAVEEELSEHLIDGDVILDGGPCLIGVESTIIDCTGPTPMILRLGAITPLMIEESTGFVALESNPSAIRVSGSLASHYSPHAKVVLDAIAVSGDGLIAPDQIPTPNGVIRLAAPSSIEEYARVLYHALRSADQQGLEVVVVLQPGGDGLAAAIRDRLQRSAAESQ